MNSLNGKKRVPIRTWVGIVFVTRFFLRTGELDKHIHTLPCVHTLALFAWLISHQPVVLFSQNKSASSSTFLSEQTSTNHQSPAK
jgi:hypothetical protein